jgi:hypothetical protein
MNGSGVGHHGKKRAIKASAACMRARSVLSFLVRRTSMLIWNFFDLNESIAFLSVGK